MDSMLMAIIAVVVIVILLAVVFFLKQRQKKPVLPTVVQPPKAIPEEITPPLDPKAPFIPEQPHEVTTPEPDPLLIAHSYIEKHDFDKAIHILQPEIRKNPKRSDLQLLLLNIFATQKDYANFDKFLPSLLSLNDPVASLQANNLKKLIDEELSLMQAMSKKTQPENVSKKDTLEFDYVDNQSAVSTPAQPASVKQPAQPITSDTLSFDNISVSTFTAPVSSAQAFVQSKTDTVQPVTTAKSEEMFDFDFDDMDFDTSVKPSPTTNASQQPAEAQGVDFPNILLDNEQAYSAPSVPADSFILDESDLVNPLTATQHQPTLQNDFEDISLEFDKPTITPVVDTPKVSNATNDDLSIDFSFDFDKPNSSKTMDKTFEIELDDTPIHTPKLQETTVDTWTLDVPEVQLSFDKTDNLGTVQTADTAKPLIDDNFLTLDTASQLDNIYSNEKPSVEVLPEIPSVKTTSISLEEALETIKDTDTTELAIQLAEQYILLSEYDSARRLLQEVNTVNPQQRQQVASLLEKIS